MVSHLVLNEVGILHPEMSLWEQVTHFRINCFTEQNEKGEERQNNV
jgi:hypothetical protein